MELLSITVLIALMTVAGGFTLRTYWLRQSLSKSVDELVTEMRGMQQRAMAESHPLVYGLRVTPGTGETSRTWSIVRYNGRRTTDKCTELEEHEFPGRVSVATASFTSAVPATDECRAAFGASSEFVLFFARGTATGGELTLTSPFVDGPREIEVFGVTGRVQGE